MMIDYTGQQVGNYRLLRRLGIGGFASVYQGQHIRIATQQAAIKILHLSDIDPQKFQQEAETTAALVHPNIIRLFDFDLFNDVSFLVMDYAPGGSLRTRHSQGTQLPLYTVIEYVKVLAGALQFAHNKKIIHRDIKPENILIGTHEELRLSDFGIAVLSLTGRTTLNPAYGTGGTPYYMAPEQCRGKPEKASDQYALAIMAYEWLCGNPPFSEGNAINIQFQHTYEPVPSLREQLPTLPEAVERVILTALAKDPKQRYQSVQAFADALESANKQPIASTPVFANTAEQAVKQPIASIPVSDDALEQTVKKPTIGTTLLIYKRSGGSAEIIAWSPDGKRLASGGADGTICIWDATSDKTFLVLRGHSSYVDAVAWSPDGRQLASGSWDKTVQVWDAISGRQLRTYKGHVDYVNAVAWSPDGRLLASGSGDKTVQVWGKQQVVKLSLLIVVILQA